MAPSLPKSSLILFMLLMLPVAMSTVFDISTFSPNDKRISFQGDAFCSSGVLQLTRNQKDLNLSNSAGRASFTQPVRIWDAKTGMNSSFITEFTFLIKAIDLYTKPADGFTFFMAPIDSEIPDNSYGGYLALFNPATAMIPFIPKQTVAVEFDTFSNGWDPAYNHIGVNINSIKSVAYVPWRSFIYSEYVGNAKITYNSAYKKLDVNVTYPGTNYYETTLSYTIDLREYLPEFIRIGFSAGTGTAVEIHNILSWKFFQTWTHYAT